MNQKTLLQNVNLTVASAQIGVLLGPGDSGKTLLLRGIAGIEKITRGTIHLGDREISKLTPSQRNLSLLNQNSALFSHLSVAKNVAMALRGVVYPEETINDRVNASLESLEIADIADRKPHQLSGSQHQRAVLARAILSQSDCLLLDEPFAGLDRRQAFNLLDLVHQVCDERAIPALIATQDPECALAGADQINVISRGQIRQNAYPERVYRRPRSSVVARIVSQANILDGKVVRSEAGVVLVDTVLGALAGIPADPNLAYESEDRVEVAIRPEAIQLDLMGPEENAFNIRIQEAQYFGSYVNLNINSNSTSLRARVSNPPGLQQFAANTEMCGWVDCDDVVIMKVEGN
ncbi:MAG: ABC transporter ATP-binding protein [Verrucomicrobiota bacterium]